MPVFQHQYATIDEVWNQPMFSPSIVNRYKENPGHTPVAISEPSEDEIRRYLNSKYARNGIEAVKGILDPAIVRDIQDEWARNQKSSASSLAAFSLHLEKEDLLYVMLGLFALLFALDSSSASS